MDLNNVCRSKSASSRVYLTLHWSCLALEEDILKKISHHIHWKLPLHKTRDKTVSLQHLRIQFDLVWTSCYQEQLKYQSRINCLHESQLNLYAKGNLQLKRQVSFSGGKLDLPKINVWNSDTPLHAIFANNECLTRCLFPLIGVFINIYY